MITNWLKKLERGDDITVKVTSPQRKTASCQVVLGMLQAKGLSPSLTRHPAICIRTDRVHPILFDYFVCVINSRAMGSTSTNYGDGDSGINSMKD
jgi:hypothetical protein